MSTVIETQKKVIVQGGERDFLVRRVELGDRYGAEHCLVHGDKAQDRREPMIEFYLQGGKYPDYDFVGSREDAIKAGAEPLGWFVSRYYASTLCKRDPKNGLCLHGGDQYSPSIKIEAQPLNEALNALGFTITDLKS